MAYHDHTALLIREFVVKPGTCGLRHVRARKFDSTFGIELQCEMLYCLRDSYVPRQLRISDMTGLQRILFTGNDVLCGHVMVYRQTVSFGKFNFTGFIGNARKSSGKVLLVNII